VRAALCLDCHLKAECVGCSYQLGGGSAWVVLWQERGSVRAALCLDCHLKAESVGCSYQLGGGSA